MSVEYRTDTLSQEDSPNQDPTRKPPRPVWRSILRGAACKCPSCGKGPLFSGFLSTEPVCSACGEELHHQRADDAPPYFTITIVGHIIIPGMLIVEMLYRPELWVHMALWVPLTLILSFALMRPVKGALIGLQWALYMHGFDPDAGDDLPEPDPATGHQ